MEGWQIALFLKPLGILLIMTLVVFPIKWLMLKFIPEGKVRRFLLFRWKV
jgi:hypothetical protein